MQIKLISFPVGGHKVNGIKALKKVFDLGLKDAKDLLESLQEAITTPYLDDCLDADALQVFKDEGGVYVSTATTLIGQVSATSIASVEKGEYDLAVALIDVLRRHTR